MNFTSTHNPFASFWMAGFECADHLNAFGNRIDLLKLTDHLSLINEDYQRLSQFNIKSVREGIRWSQIEKQPYHYDWSEVAQMIKFGKQNNIQQIWDLCHFGFPDDLTPLHPMFPRRFAAMCRAFIEFYRSVDSESTLIITPINEVSFLSWLGGDVRGTSPYCVDQGWEVKYQLVKAYIEGIEALKEADNNVRVFLTEPLVNVVPPINASSEQIQEALKEYENQFQVFDMVAGYICPELRGKPEYLDILGLNYYSNNQWVFGRRDNLSWKNGLDDPRWRPLNEMLQEVHSRYGLPLVLSETSYPGEEKPLWLTSIAKECAVAIDNQIPLWGICYYPVIDRPDWDHLTPYCRSGLWDTEFVTGNDTPQRILHQSTAEALIKSQLMIEKSSKKNQLQLASAI
ncbi:MAG: amine oxidase [Chitinophagales bacterium]|nr:amine oxidase [Chitinophagales bacterium]